MTNKKQKFFEIESLCPLLAIMWLEGRTEDYGKSMNRMYKAHLLNGGVEIGQPEDVVLSYLQSLQKEASNG